MMRVLIAELITETTAAPVTRAAELTLYALTVLGWWSGASAWL